MKKIVIFVKKKQIKKLLIKKFEAIRGAKY